MANKLNTSVGADKQTAPNSGSGGTAVGQDTNTGQHTDKRESKKKDVKTAQSNRVNTQNESDSVRQFAAEQQRQEQDDIGSFARYQQAQEDVSKLPHAQRDPKAPAGLPDIPPQGDDKDKQSVSQILGAKETIGEAEVREARRILEDYKAKKANLDQRILANEEWYKLRHWELLRRANQNTYGNIEPVTGWLFNCIASKHADAIDNYPTCNILPREESDEQVSGMLSNIIPCVLERNHFERAYSDAWWYKLKHGTSCYGIFWDNHLENGTGDICVRNIDLLKVFWQPGITDIQQSRNLFIVDYLHRDTIRELYPDLDADKLAGATGERQYLTDDYADMSDMVPVVDWYYKRMSEDGTPTLHYCKFIDEHVLFASENESGYESGYYEHGQYPIVFDVMYPIGGTCYGFGLIDLGKDNQLYIDQLDQDIMRNLEISAHPRFFYKRGCGVNKEQLLNTNEPLIEFDGQLDDRNLKPMDVPTMPAALYNIRQQKIDELKETTSNRDVNTGTVGSGVTAASAISALQEAGNKNSRDIIEAGYRAFQEICTQVLELMRQFYTADRYFRITGDNGKDKFVAFNAGMIADQQLPEAYPGQDAAEGVVSKRPVFDIRIEAEKRSPYQRLSQNTFIMELYNAGFFQPENAQAALAAIDCMEFEGKDKLRGNLQQGQTLLSIIQQMQAQMQQMQQMLGMMQQPDTDAEPDESAQQDEAQDGGSGNSAGGRALRAQTANSSEQKSTLQEKAKAGAKADMNNKSGRTAPT